MQITINQTEIEKAILDFMHKRINIKEGTQVDIEMKATRGAEGFSAVIDIMDSPAEHAEMVQKEKERQTKVKEEKLEEAGRFLEATVKQDEPEDKETDDTETASASDEQVSEPEEAKPAKKAPNTSIFNKVTRA